MSDRHLEKECFPFGPTVLRSNIGSKKSSQRNLHLYGLDFCAFILQMPGAEKKSGMQDRIET